ncbi:hypothetical protein [Mesorhizobium sp.]|uniref:hypothetical protein n=1 Tax=Mesorhizobium sp. TaxID=1871066 RepID=UPI00257F090A|nr:hypothetical protein [Mesorhizobium sp.]
MSEHLLLVALLALGPFLLAEGLLARYELMVYTIGRRAPAATLPPEVPYARGADPGRPPDAYVVYLDGIGKRRLTDTRDGGQLVKAIIAGAPELRVLGQVQPYSPLADPLVGRPVWDWLRRHVGITLFLHNVMQTFVAADRRYRPLYNRAVGAQIADQLRLAGYEPASGIPVVLLCYSGGAQVATGAVEELFAQFRAPLLLITLGGFHNGANDLTHAHHLYRLTSANDWIERSDSSPSVGACGGAAPGTGPWTPGRSRCVRSTRQRTSARRATSALRRGSSTGAAISIALPRS